MKPPSIPDFHRRLAAWYGKHGRKDLPWRKTRDPYRIWLSEVMLQQTQVKTIKERYWKPFLAKFPTLEALARAPRSSVLKAWEGMGYYNRAVNLHEAAKQCKGTFPKTVEELVKLPGIGRNTAHAVAAFAYGTPVPVMEANVKRVLCRIFGIKTPAEKTLWKKAEELMGLSERTSGVRSGLKEKTTNPFDYNQAMMDMGALICTPKAPKCKECPANKLCKGIKTPESYPLKKKKPAAPIKKRTIVVLTDGARYFIARREGKFLNGLYGFPESGPGSVSLMLGKMVYLLTGDTLLGRVRQTYSHFTLDADVHRIIISPGRAKTVEGTWKTLAQISRLPTSRADQKIIALIANSKV